jgi:hypothetical protein
MWKAPASVLCLAALPLFGCAGGYTVPQAAVSPTPVTESTPYYAAAPRAYTAGPSAPAAILVFLPGADVLAREPALWEAQGFDVVVPPAADIYRLVADQEAAMARLIASAQAMADAPIWLVGPSQAIEAAMPHAGGGVSGVVVTSMSSPVASCSESFSYYDPGTGAPPQVHVRKSGDCGAVMPGNTGGQPSILQPSPAPRSHQPRIIEASAVGKNLPPDAKVRRLAQLIKAVPPS